MLDSKVKQKRENNRKRQQTFRNKRNGSVNQGTIRDESIGEVEVESLPVTKGTFGNDSVGDEHGLSAKESTFQNEEMGDAQSFSVTNGTCVNDSVGVEHGLSVNGGHCADDRASMNDTVILESDDSPVKVIPWLDQRVHDVRKKLPKDPDTRAAVVVRMCSRAFLSPSTKDKFPSYLSRDKTLTSALQRLDKKKIYAINASFRQATKLRKQKKPDEAKNLLSKFGMSMRQISETVNVHYSQLHNVINMKKSENQGRNVTDGDKADVLKHYGKNSVSVQFPHKRYNHKRYLRDTREELYDQYAAEQKEKERRVLSISSVDRIIGKEFKTSDKTPKLECECKDCLNYGLTSSAMIVQEVRGIHRKFTDNILDCLCPCKQQAGPVNRRLNMDNDVTNDRFTILDVDRDCLFRFCTKCGVMKKYHRILEENKSLQLHAPVHWRQWVKDDSGRTITVDFKTPLVTLIKHWCYLTESMSNHLFDYKWQGHQFEKCKNRLKHGDVLFVMDFAQNLTHRSQNEAQSAHWKREATTLHPIVCYYRCPQSGGCNEIVTHDMAFVTPDLSHDPWAIYTFETTAISVLKERGIRVKRIFEFTDNCAGQYKSRRVFLMLSKWQIPIHRNYFGSMHGKGPSDGVSGRLAKLMEKAVNTGTDIRNTAEFAFYFKKHWATEVPREATVTCMHNHRSIQYIRDIDRETCTDDGSTIPATRIIHSVRNVGIHGVVEVRRNSCFCRSKFVLYEVDFKHLDSVIQLLVVVSPSSRNGIFTHVKYSTPKGLSFVFFQMLR